jgi:hypothetical protein
MLKLSALALGLLTVISIAPATLANPVSGYYNSDVQQINRDSRQKVNAVVYQRNDRDNRPQVNAGIYQHNDRANRPQVVVVNTSPQTRWEVRRRQLELARSQQARSQWNTRYSHHRHYDHNYGNNANEYYYNR